VTYGTPSRQPVEVREQAAGEGLAVLRLPAALGIKGLSTQPAAPSRYCGKQARSPDQKSVVHCQRLGIGQAAEGARGRALDPMPPTAARVGIFRAASAKLGRVEP